MSKIFILAGVVSCLLFVGCGKQPTTKTEPCCSTSYSDDQGVPYDASSVDGVFVANIVTDSLDQSYPLKASYFAQIVAADTARVSANGLSLTKDAGGFHSDLKSLSLDTSLNFFNVSWIIQGNPGHNFTYSNIDTFPSCKYILPDTLTPGINTIFYFDHSILNLADTVMLTIYAPGNGDSVNYLQYHCSASIPDRIEIPTDIAQSLSGKSIRMTIGVYNSRIYTFNSEQYLFIKAQTQTGYVWFR